MATAHVNYEPTEYEQMLIAAGWVTIESLDTEYLEYSSGNNDAASYSTWQYLRRQLDELNAEYERDIQPLYDATPSGNIGYFERKQEERLLASMSSIEVALGY